MRPRVFPAEDRGDPAAARGGGRSFNEAAGIPAEDRKTKTKTAHYLYASMRPRVFPAEDSPLRVMVPEMRMLQ